MPAFATDALGRRVRLDAPPRRIVSLVPSQTELLADLGMDDEVVGLTRFCIHPADWKDRKAIIGGTKNVRIERVRDLAPDFVIANREENVREQVEALAKIAPVYVTDVSTVADALAMIRAVGRLVDRTDRATALADEIATCFQHLANEITGPAEPLRALYLIWRDPWMTVGGDTFIHDVLTRAGLANVVADRSRYPTLSNDEIRPLAPDVVLLSSEPYPFTGHTHRGGAGLVPAAQVELVDGELLSWYGSRMLRTPDSLRALRQRLGENDRAPRLVRSQGRGTPGGRAN